MAFSIHALKIKEDKVFTFYEYQDTGSDCKGLIKINRKTGDVFEVILADGDSGAKAKRASWAILRCWTKGNLPKETWWES